MINGGGDGSESGRCVYGGRGASGSDRGGESAELTSGESSCGSEVPLVQMARRPLGRRVISWTGLQRRRRRGDGLYLRRVLLKSIDILSLRVSY